MEEMLEALEGGIGVVMLFQVLAISGYELGSVVWPSDFRHLTP